eukprot:9101676-Pyramimonas_sp.AAC.2
MVTKSARRQSSSAASARAAEASSRRVIGRFPGRSGGAEAPGRRAEMQPLSLALQWGHRIGMEPPPSMKICGWLCLHCSRQCSGTYVHRVLELPPPRRDPPRR